MIKNIKQKLLKYLIIYRRLVRSFQINERSHEVKENIISFEDTNYHTFFGYYDKTPFNSTNDRILASRFPRNKKLSNSHPQLQIGFYNISQPENFVQVSSTPLWCWQQGCRLQWYEKGNPDLVIYNRMVDNNYGSVVQNINSREIVEEYSSTIYDVSKCGSYALTLNFSRLQRLRPGYGYLIKPDLTQKENLPHDDGVFLFDLNTKKKELIIPLTKLIEINNTFIDANSIHYVNHLSFNSDGSRFLFFHLWVNGKKRFSRLFTSDKDGKDLRLWENELNVSHYFWKNNIEIVITAADYQNRIGYYLYNDETGLYKEMKSMKLEGDGHPSYFPPKKTFITDTYPDRYSERSLLLFDDEINVKKLASLYSPYEFRGEYRCDLHPRWDREGNYICFDSAHEGYRGMYILTVDK